MNICLLCNVIFSLYVVVAQRGPDFNGHASAPFCLGLYHHKDDATAAAVEFMIQQLTPEEGFDEFWGGIQNCGDGDEQLHQLNIWSCDFDRDDEDDDDENIAAAYAVVQFVGNIQ